MFAGRDVVQIGNVLQPWDIQQIQNKMKQVRKKKMRRIAEKTELSQYQLFHPSLVTIFRKGHIRRKSYPSCAPGLAEAGWGYKGL